MILMFNNSTFDISLNDDFFKDKGEYVYVYRSMLCPCGSDPSRAYIACPLCGGTGRIYPDPPILKKVILTSVEQEAPELVAQGLAIAGDIVMTEIIADDSPVEQFDIVIPKWQGTPYMGQIVTRGTSSTDTLFYKAYSVDKCISVDTSTGTITTYIPNVDFVVNGNTITWISSNQPAPNTNYSIRYTTQFEYVVFQPSLIRRENSTELGAKALLRKRHLVLPNLPANYLKEAN